MNSTQEKLYNELMTNKNYIEPKVGDKIYVGSSFYVYRGEDDFSGGLATINKVEYSKSLPKGHHNYTFIGLEERPNTMYNWNNLMENQEKLKKEYSGKIAHPDPDDRAEFNSQNADWK